MRQGAILFFSFLMAAIVGCGSGAGSPNNFAGTTTNPSLSTGSSPVTGGSNSAPGATPGTGATTPPGSSSPSGSSNDGGTAASGTASSNPPATTATSSATEVTIVSPVEGAAVNSPTQVTASVSGSAAISSMQLYVDDVVSFQAALSQVNAALPLPNGAHTIVAQAWDQNGNAYKSAPVHIVVQGAAAPAPPTPAPPAPAQPIAPAAKAAQIQTQPGWADCDICAGAAGNGPGTPHGMQEGVSSPSLSGSAARFDLGGTAWGAALWWRELGGHDDAQNLRYDLDFYIDSVSNGQALEFDVNQTVGGSRYIFGTECDFRGSGTWRVWNAPNATWASTGVPCPVPGTNIWHHLTWEFQRGGGQTHFIAVTLDGNRHDVGMSFGTKGEAGSGLDVAFQADLTGSGGSESIWLDNVNLSW
jgi:Big-like domain-containing protein